MSLSQPPLALAGLGQNSQSTPFSTAAEAGPSRHSTYTLPQANVQVVSLKLDASIKVAVSEGLAPVETFSAQQGVQYAINGGFFDPQNGKTTSYLTVNGQLSGDPAGNERLVQNPNLQQYLPQILNRSEFRAYRCESDDGPRYDITFHNAAVPDGCAIKSAVGAGPQLLPADTSVAEAFTDYKNGELIRDAIGSMQPNARSAIGIDANGAIFLLMAEKNADSSGMTLTELAEFARSLGIVKLLNLDGGSSSSLYVRGEKTYAGLADADNNPIHRPVKSVIIAGE
ncbi:MAG: phosphodiester glycosidase family protein [Phormidesmis sp.]